MNQANCHPLPVHICMGSSGADGNLNTYSVSPGAKSVLCCYAHGLGSDVLEALRGGDKIGRIFP